MSLSKKIDIIIPIYNAYDELLRCLESIWKWTEFKDNRLILINDKSSDERVYKFLNEIKHDNVIVIYNQENKGFPANINIGMEQSDSDVVLLNSDTVVTQNWLEKLSKCAYRDSTIATVTPLSNNATLCSVPNFCEENDIPDGYELDEYAQLIERVSLKKYPQIPVANGFCMYIKREVIERIGNFDAETFGKGYGEENDFCYRAIEAGYHHVMCDDTFILHTGTSSFVSEEKKKNIQEHEKILNAKYPTLSQNVRIHCRDNPNAAISENIRMWSWLNRREKRKTILYLVQSDFRSGAKDNIGGTQLHVKDLTMGMRSCYDIIVAARNGSYLNVTIYTKNEEFPFQYYIGCKSQYEQFRSKKMAQLYSCILENFGVDCLHIHHTAGLTLELYYVAAEKGLPIFVTLHDYYYLCPSVKMLDSSNRVCIGKDKDGKCGECLSRQQGIADTVPYISIWRKENLAALKLANAVFVPSFSAKKIISGYFPEIQERIEVIEHGLEPFAVEKGRILGGKKNFHVAFLGGINVAKGYLYATDLIKKGNKGVKWHLFGFFEQEKISIEKRRNFISVGKYEREELPQMFEKYSIDLVCILALWPETFCYTISEAVACGVPVLVTDVGALGDRVRALECGWVVPADVTSADILQKIYEIRDNKAEYQKVIDKINKIEIRTRDEMCMIYKKRYENILENQIDSKAVYNGAWLIEGVAMQKRIPILGEATGVTQASLEELEMQLESIKSSMIYRFIRKLLYVDIPFKRQIKSLVRKAYGVVRKRN